MLHDTIDTLDAAADQTPEAGEEARLLEAGDIEITREEVADVCLFLAGDRGQAWLKRFTDGAYYTRWFDGCQRSPYDIKWCNELAAKILAAKATAECPGEIESVVEEQFTGGQEPDEVYYEEHDADVTSSIEDISRDLDDLREDDDTIPEFDEEEWKEAVRDRIIDHMADNDDSSVMDMLGSYDRCEIVIRLSGSESISSNRPWADFDDLSIDESLQQGLASLGYTIGDYRRMTGSKAQSHGLRRCFKRRPQPLVSEGELREIVANACSAYFGLVIYAVVPVVSLIELDLTRPFSLSQYAVASYNEGSGTFFDILRKEPLIVHPGEGLLDSPTGYRPEDICGLYIPAYTAEIANVD